MPIWRHTSATLCRRHAEARKTLPSWKFRPTGRRTANTSTPVEVKPPGRLFEPRRRRPSSHGRSRRVADGLRIQVAIQLPFGQPEIDRSSADAETPGQLRLLQTLLQIVA